MKKILLLKILIFSFSLFTQFIFAQTLESLKNGTTKPIKTISRLEYSSFKENGELSEKYEYKIINSKLVPQNNQERPSSPNSLTPCDPIPTTGNIGFAGQVNIDDDYVVVPIGFNFCFYGTNYTSLNLTENGNVQFSTNSTAFNSTGFPSSTVNMIAPFWADAESMVQAGGRTYGKIYIDKHPTYMIITWDSMSYYNDNVDKLNSFQLVLTNGLDPILPAGKNVGFYYKKMQWTTGDASGGTNGFPTTQPGTPATVGVNAGNGIDYFLIGRFGVPGTIYDSPLGNSDGVSWLDGKRFFFNVCPPISGNQEPTSLLIGYCDTLKVCGNDTLIIKNTFIAPEVTQSVNITATSAPTGTNAPLGSSFTYSTTTNSNGTDIYFTITNPPAATDGVHIITMNATDNGSPPQSSVQTFYVYVNAFSINDLNAAISLTEICPGGMSTASVVATSGLIDSYFWSNLSSTQTTTYSPGFPSDTLVYVNIKSGQCEKTISNYIRVNPVPVASITGSLSLCSGTNSTTVLTASNTLNFAAQSPYTFSWFGSPTAPSPTNTQTTTATGGTYSVTVTNKYNCKSSAVVTVTLNTTPVFTVVPTNTLICSGTNVPLSINFNTSPPTSCGLATSGCSATSTRTIGSGTSSNGNMSAPTPYSNYYMSSHIQMLFKASELTAAGIVAGKISSIGFNINSLNSFSVALKNYTIKMKCTSITALTSTFDNTGLSQVYFINSYMPTSGSNTHNYSQAYEWDGTSNILVDICYDRYTTPSTYVSNGSTSAFYTTTAFTSVRYDEDDTQDLCGSSTSASTSTNRPNARFGNCASTPSPSSFSYNWSPSTGLSNPNIANPIANLSSSIQYSVVVTPTAATTCSNVSTTSLTVVSPVMPTITAVSALCSNAASFTLSGQPTGGTWSLTPSTSTLGVFSPSLATIGNNTVSYSYSGPACLQTTTAIVPIEKYVPSTITGTINPLCISNPVVNLSTALTTSTLGVGAWSGNGVTGNSFDPAVAGAASHTLTYSTQSNPTATLCPQSSTIAVTVNSVVQPTIAVAGPFCDNYTPQQMNAAPVGGVWSGTSVGTSISASGLFTPNASLLGNNKLYYTLTNAPCVKKDSIIVDVVQFIPATITGTLGPYCIYDPAVNLQTIAQFAGGVWSGSGVTTTSFTPSMAGAGAHPLTYNTDPTPNGLCPDAQTISILVKDKPEANIVPSNLGGCNYPWNIDFTTSTVNTGIASWNFGDGSENSNGLMVSHTYTTPGTFMTTLTYTDNAGCKDTTLAVNSVTIFPVPDAAFEPSLDVTTVVDAEIIFTNQTSNLPNNIYIWNFGNSDNSTQINPTYLYTNSGEFFVTLLAISPDLCRDTVVKKITINPDVVLYVPNAFTPGNNDGLNDVFQIFLPPTGVDYSTFNLVIYDRWGEAIFKTTDVNESWTGAKNNSGDILKQEIFIWKITFKDDKKKYYEKTGHVSLIIK